MRSLAALLALVGCLVLTASAAAAPTPGYNVAPSPPVEDQQATFTSTSTATPLPDPPPDPVPDPLITKVEWDFDDNGNIDEEGTSVTHTYGSPGDKTFRMRVTDWTGEVTTSQFTITVAAKPPPPPPPNQSPVPQFTFDDSSPRVGQQVSVESFSFDPDGNVTKVEWDFDGDQDYDDGDANETDNVGSFPGYSTPGTKTIRLRVTDNDNATSVLARSLTVGPLPDNVSPVANFAFQPAGPVVGQQVTVESFSHDPDGNVTKVEWDFDGDADYDDGDGIETDNLGSFTYTTPGTKTIRLKVTDNDNASTVLAREVTVAPAPPNKLPVVSIAVSPKRPTVGEQTSFQSFAYDPDGSVAAQRWDLDGDGDFDEDVTGPTAFTTFTTPGKRVVRLQVRDNEGALQTATVDVDVQPAAVVRPSALGLLTPFPIVRLAGSVVARGTHVRLLEVRAPRRSLVTVRCAGPGCPDKALRKRAKGKRLRFLAMQRLLRPDTLVSVAVSRSGAIGKFTRWKIRRMKVPKRTDRCLWPSGRRSRCPAA